jgi:hypothetical protein
MLYGRSTGLSPVAVVISATFWTALWGPIGLVLATPLTVCLVVLGRHVERLQFLDVMFGDRPALSPPEIFYQRMLAGDPTEAAGNAEEFLKERSLSSYFDEVAVKGLKLAQADLHRKALDSVRVLGIRDAVDELVADLSDQKDQEPVGGQPTVNAEAIAAVENAGLNRDADLPIVTNENRRPEWRGEPSILCIAGRTALDESAAIMFAQLCGVHGLAARVEGAEALSSNSIVRLDPTGIALVCLSYIDLTSPAHMRFAVRRLRRKLPSAKFLLGCWDSTEDAGRLEEYRENAKAEFAAFSLREAIRICVNEASEHEPLIRRAEMIVTMDSA